MGAEVAFDKKISKMKISICLNNLNIRRLRRGSIEGSPGAGEHHAKMKETDSSRTVGPPLLNMRSPRSREDRI